MQFRNLKIGGWRQFKSINLDFHPQLTIITGANGAGKTTILNILASHFGWQAALVSTPLARHTPNGSRYISDIWDEEIAEFHEYFEELITHYSKHELSNLRSSFLSRRDSGMFTDVQTYYFRHLFENTARQFDDNKRHKLSLAFIEWLTNDRLNRMSHNPLPVQDGCKPIGSITYMNGVPGIIQVPTTVNIHYGTSIRDMQNAMGIHIPSHRPIYNYQMLENIPVAPKGRQEMLDQYCGMIRARWRGDNAPRTPNYYIKENLISLAMFGLGNEVIEPNKDYMSLFNGFQDILRKVLPPTFGFVKFSIRVPEVVMVTKTGDVSLDAVSGGIASIIDIAWQVFMYQPEQSGFAVTYDEPENHLHPELQRSFLPNLIRAFPEVQFIIATHNPFMIGSVPDSSVYALTYTETRSVKSDSLNLADKSGTANEILRDILGMPMTQPLWVEGRLESILREFRNRMMTADALDELRSRLEGEGLSHYIPEGLAKFADSRRVE